MKLRRPQSRCVCSCAKSKHTCMTYGKACNYCCDCNEFRQDNLATLKALYNYYERKGELRYDK